MYKVLCHLVRKVRPLAHNIVSISGGRRRHQKPTWRLHRADPSNLAANQMDGAEHGVIASRCVSKEKSSAAFMVNGSRGREVKRQRDPASRKRVCGRGKKEWGEGQEIFLFPQGTWRTPQKLIPEIKKLDYRQRGGALAEGRLCSPRTCQTRRTG